MQTLTLLTSLNISPSNPQITSWLLSDFLRELILCNARLGMMWTLLYSVCTGGVGVYSVHKWVRVSRVWVVLEPSRGHWELETPWQWAEESNISKEQPSVCLLRGKTVLTLFVSRYLIFIIKLYFDSIKRAYWGHFTTHSLMIFAQRWH